MPPPLQSELFDSWCFTLGNNSARINFSKDCHLLHHSFSCPYAFSGPECISVTGHVLTFCAALRVLHMPCLSANIFRMLLSNLWLFRKAVLFGVEFCFCWFCYHEENRWTQSHWVWKEGATSLRAKNNSESGLHHFPIAGILLHLFLLELKKRSDCKRVLNISPTLMWASWNTCQFIWAFVSMSYSSSNNTKCF